MFYSFKVDSVYWTSLQLNMGETMSRVWTRVIVSLSARSGDHELRPSMMTSCRSPENSTPVGPPPPTKTKGYAVGEIAPRVRGVMLRTYSL